jgi:hypothetical protein
MLFSFFILVIQFYFFTILTVQVILASIVLCVEIFFFFHLTFKKYSMLMPFTFLYCFFRLLGFYFLQFYLFKLY